MTDRMTRDEYGLALAQAAAGRADCTRRQVGAVIVAEDGSVVTTGYNGLASGLPGCLTAGACPRGQMSYPEPKPCEVGDPDPTPAFNLSEPFCNREHFSRGDSWVCTLPIKHESTWHIAGDGDEACDVWQDEDAAEATQAASVGYEATGCRAVHAEVNAVIRAGRAACVGTTLYCTDEPCFHCSVVIEGAGITRVVYPDGEVTFASPASRWQISSDLWTALDPKIGVIL